MASSPPSSFLFFLFLLLLSTSVGWASSSSDLQQLLSFRASLPDPARTLPSWQPGANPCTSFAGVSCSASRVSSLHLDGCPLNADFRSSISVWLLTLDFLETLSLRNTNLSGELTPMQGARCGGRVVELDLAGNALWGSITEIPALTAACPSLRVLNLSANALGFNPSSAGGAERIGLDVIDLSSNRVSVDGALGWFLASRTGLRELVFTGNAVSGAIPAVGNYSSLQRLDLSSNSISGVAPFAFVGCGSLNYLNLSDNNIAGELPRGLFGDCQSLTDHDIASNNLSGTLPSNISSCSGLVTLSLSNNNLSGELPMETLMVMAGLKRLQLSFNYISGKLPDALLSKLPGLEVLDLSSNSLRRSIPAGLYQSYDSGIALQELYLQNNQLTGAIPASISNCSMLTSLDLSFNYLNGGILSSLGTLSRLQYLILWQNLLEGGIPPELAHLQARTHGPRQTDRPSSSAATAS